MATTDTQQAAQFSAEAAVSAAEAKQYLIEAQQGYQDTSEAAQEAKNAAESASSSEQNAATSEANALQSATEASAARDEAVVAASTASEFGDNKFTFYKTSSDPDGTIAGLAATTNGQSFRVAQGVDGTDAFITYQNDNGVAVAQAAQPGTAAITGTVREYSTLSLAENDVAAGNILDGSKCWVANDNLVLSDEYINNGGTLEKTGRTATSKEYIDNLIYLEVARIMASGAAQTASIYPDIAQLTLDEVGHATYRRLSDGTSQFPALMVGAEIEFVQLEGGGFVCQRRATGEEIFNISSLGYITNGNLTSWFTDDESISDYSEIHMDPQGRIYRRVRRDGTVEQVGDDTPDDDASEFPMVASVDGNIIAVDGSDVTQITNDSGVSNIAPVAYAEFLRYLSNVSGNYITYRSTYDGNYRARESLRFLVHLIITGQSLAAGGSTQAQSPVTTTAQADYGILSFETGPKVDFKYDTLNESLLEAVIPCRENAGTRPGQESPSSGMAFKIHDLTGHTVLVSDACSSGTAIADISSGSATFTGATKMIQSAVAMAEKLGMQYVPVMVLIHGNQNAAAGTSISSYRAAMETLRAQYESVINAATGKSQSLHMFVGQLSNTIPYGGTAGTTKTNNIGIAQYQEARDNALIHLASAQYARPYSDGEHLTSAGYRTEGEVIGAVVGGWLNDNTKSSLAPIESGVVQSGTTITIPVAGCVGDLVIDTSRVTDPGNYGFVLTGATIASVAVSGSGTTAKIVITKTDSTTATLISYASQGIAGQNPGPVTGSRGCIRDSQTGTSLSGLPLYNDLCVFSIQL
ncbi:TPA: hypothetical protein ACNINJ_002007 [Klebsiella pneumoniae]|uniref:hypothetical protein n=1 Tax=Klebsiella pneumoniae TaxID=573 RepID=UPI001CC0DF24|nr:hypothetical protein [Klebsiella pneumoniae]HDS9440898.1 hypothetical protein [Klebsiella pneumoniae subsp. pneumoniae]MBZ1667626.1 hypothetical protein [Klebsiella pneumoniae]WJT64260.1 hypothetical protein QU726_19175 [Klebsiella pneumoniae]WLX00868.1 hypothetical protein RA223_07555 [Klebsiella pneumoniae]GKN64971.1 hypothetical protein NUBL22004_12110 [Klebsiella pneumoniae]